MLNLKSQDVDEMDSLSGADKSQRETHTEPPTGLDQSSIFMVAAAKGLGDE